MFQEELELFTFYFWIFTTKPNTTCVYCNYFQTKFEIFSRNDRSRSYVALCGSSSVYLDKSRNEHPSSTVQIRAQVSKSQSVIVKPVGMDSYN